MSEQLRFELDAQPAVRKKYSYMVDWYGNRVRKVEGLELWIPDPSWEFPGDEEEVIDERTEQEERERLRKWNDSVREG